jgi:hypothetical protein
MQTADSRYRPALALLTCMADPERDVLLARLLAEEGMDDFDHRLAAWAILEVVLHELVADDATATEIVTDAVRRVEDDLLPSLPAEVGLSFTLYRAHCLLLSLRYGVTGNALADLLRDFRSAGDAGRDDVQEAVGAILQFSQSGVVSAAADVLGDALVPMCTDAVERLERGDSTGSVASAVLGDDA